MIKEVIRLKFIKGDKALNFLSGFRNKCILNSFKPTLNSLRKKKEESKNHNLK